MTQEENYFVGKCCNCGREIYKEDLKIIREKPYHKNCNKTGNTKKK